MKLLQIGMINMLYHSAEYSTYKTVFIFSVTAVFLHSLQSQNIVPASTNDAISILYSMAAATWLHLRFMLKKKARSKPHLIQQLTNPP